MYDYRDRIQDAYERGEMDEADYEWHMNQADEWEAELMGRSSSDVQYSIGVDEKAESDYDKPISDLELRGEPKNKPRSSREWHVFNRSFANKTAGMKPGDTRNVLITTDRYVYVVSADGYMTGYAEEKIRISQNNRERIWQTWRYYDELNRNRETFDSWFSSVQSGQGDNRWNSRSTGDGETTATDDILYDEPQGSDRSGYSEGTWEDSWEIDYESLGPGAMFFDGEKAYQVVETEDGLQHIEIDLGENDTNDDNHSDRQYTINDTVSRKNVVSGLKDILARGGDISELRQYVARLEQSSPVAEQNAPYADQNTEEAEHILRSAKQQGIGVEEYLRQNWELYETETGWDPAARKALELEKGSNRQYSIRATSKMPYKTQLELIEQGRMNGSNSLYIGIPSVELQYAGLSGNPFAMNQGDYKKSRRKAGKNKHYSAHAVPYDFFENMPEHLNKAPLLVDNGEKVTIITAYPMADTKGKDSFVVSGVWLDNPMESDTVNQSKSVYPWDDFINRITNAAKSGQLVAVNKNKAAELLATIGVQPSEVSRILDLAKQTLSQSKINVKQCSISDTQTESADAKESEAESWGLLAMTSVLGNCPTNQCKTGS